MDIPEVIQRLDAGTIIEMFELDTTVIGGVQVLLFINSSGPVSLPTVWQGRTFSPFPIEVNGFETSGVGTFARPRMKVSNTTGLMYPLLDDHDDLVGAKLTRYRTFYQYLDGQPGADPNQHFDDDIYYVERKVTENLNYVEMELASAIDLEGFQLPARQITVNSCTWGYRSSECSYVGTNYFNVNNVAVGSLGQDVCGKTVAACKARFGARGRLPFGGFPATRAYKS